MYLIIVYISTHTPGQTYAFAPNTNCFNTTAKTVVPLHNVSHQLCCLVFGIPCKICRIYNTCTQAERREENNKNNNTGGHSRVTALVLERALWDVLIIHCLVSFTPWQKVNTGFAIYWDQTREVILSCWNWGNHRFFTLKCAWVLVLWWMFDEYDLLMNIFLMLE